MGAYEEPSSYKVWIAAGGLAAAPLVLLLAIPAAPGGSRSQAAFTAGMPALTHAADVADDVTPTPAVTSPSQSVARFSTAELPLIASVVQVRCAVLVRIARIGGLYGP